MTNTDDTIVAVSSPPGRSLRGLVRITGPGVMVIVGDLLEPPNEQLEQLRAWPSPRRLVACRVRLPSVQDATDNQSWVSLPTMMTLFPSPGSYTGQDLAEIQCVGHPSVLDRLVRRITELGARLAEGGEFTFRAFVAGKIDLTQAEGVAATISATSEGELAAAALLRQGRLGGLAQDLVDALAKQLSLVEAGIDFTDQDDVVPITAETLGANLKRVATRLESLLANSRSWGELEAVPRVVLAGAPSVGKSTLFNALLGRQRAVIAATAHTTRDALVEPMTLTRQAGQRAEVLLIDIAGLDTPISMLDRQAQAAAQREIEKADLVLQVNDDRCTAWPSTLGKAVIRVRTKVDLGDTETSGRDEVFDVAVSATLGTGLDRLREVIAQRLQDRLVSISGQMLALGPRHETAIRRAIEAIQTAQRLTARQPAGGALSEVELIASALRDGLDELAGLGGTMTPEDILGRVFSTFCIGK